MEDNTGVLKCSLLLISDSPFNYLGAILWRHVWINCKRTQERSEKKPAYLASEDEKVSTASEIKLPCYKKTVFSLNL